MKNFIKIITLVGAIFSLVEVQAQQEPMYTHYMYNLMSVNPAYAGTRGATSVSLLSRTQWMGFDNNPKTNVVSAHTPFSVGQSGVGISVLSDVISPVNSLYLDLNYAHRVMLTPDITLSLGIKGSMLNSSATLSDLVSNDPAFTDGSYFNYNFGVGAFLYTDNYYVGLSVPRLIESEMSSGTTNMGTITRHYFFTAGYIYKLNEDFQLKPSAFMKKVASAPASWDVALETLYNKRFGLGVNYRVKESVSILASIIIFDKMTVGYSYDIPITNFGSYSSGSHEIYLSYDFIPIHKKKVKSPRFF